MEKMKDLALILGVYVIYAALTVFVYGSDRFTGDALPTWPIVMLCVSLGCMLVWYALGEWVVPLHSRKVVWWTIWILLLVVIAGVAVYVIFREARDVAASTDLVAHPWFLFLGSTGFYYLASVVRSPTFARGIFWPNSRLRHLQR